MEKISVEYCGGDSRFTPGKAIDYMLATAEINGELVELYAEMENDTWNDETGEFDDDTATYDGLKEEIIDQAKSHGIPVDSLSFQYDAENGTEDGTRYWFAVMENRSCKSFGYGSFDKREAIELAKMAGPDAYIAVVDGGYNENGYETKKEVCIAEIVQEEF